MSLYYETADILMPAGPEAGTTTQRSSSGSLKSRIFTKKGLKSPAAQVFALATETCKWSEVLKEVIDNADLLRHERKLTPVLALLLVHDFLLSKGGITLPQSHGLRQAIERHKARLTSELTRARLRRKMASLDALRVQIKRDGDPEGRHPRWVRVNALKTDIEEQLESTFKDFERVLSIAAVTATGPSNKSIYLDDTVPGLVAVSPGIDLTKTKAYKAGQIILQDKASCFPAYLLDPHAEDGDVIDSCAAPGNKTTHLAAITHSHRPEESAPRQTIFAFERDERRAKTLEKMVKTAGSEGMTTIGLGQDFLEVDPQGPLYRNVGALLLDPSCSGSGIVGRDVTPELHLPGRPPPPGAKGAPKKKLKLPKPDGKDRKRKRDADDEAKPVLIDDDGNATVVSSEQDLQKRLQSLSSFQLTLLLHAMKFPSARKITYSTCSVHAEENEQVVVKALRSEVAREAGWRILPRAKQVRGMREWPVRGVLEASDGDQEVAEACVRAKQGDGRGVMGFFVAAFERDVVPPAPAEGESKLFASEDGPYLRDDEGMMVRDVTGMPVLKSTGRPVALPGAMHLNALEGQQGEGHEHDESSDDHDYEDESPSKASSDSEGSEGDEWGGIDDRKNEK
ncbi:S-adenosyl-L-methionine-dependent methyltransferase [Sodiomyces alkalinus F11]|uniref:S-adenosyl-L-methionine-dependent methyltransferase n=1 Tax=Sodiomyces alkalinus (strain CBS 110278 / VKM F-3762 / F11) TaxID=1314773 RepID=A0A3N2PNC4_SODAK|nr:S-adenosyl-L-methionine-dependent methyltransferase [Sodiomyces alkalinus F11]ROT35999.1 S-adenosyl-L-methionine-dependent methyltransferase [Sodiomyces alkalinus F11]